MLLIGDLASVELAAVEDCLLARVAVAIVVQRSAQKKGPRRGLLLLRGKVEGVVSSMVAAEVDTNAGALHLVGLFVFSDDADFGAHAVGYRRLSCIEAAELAVVVVVLEGLASARLGSVKSFALTSPVDDALGCLDNGLGVECLVRGRCLGLGGGFSGDDIDIDCRGLVFDGLGVVSGAGVCSHG